MTKTKNIIIAVTVAILAITAFLMSKSTIDRVIKDNELSKTAVISVSVRDAKNGKLVYEKDGNLLLHPASTLKAFTSPIILNYLGNDNMVKTSLYKDKDNLYLKLSGDPLLTSEELHGLFKNVRDGSLVIDDSAIDNVEWGVGWMWDDETNPLMPKFGAYNLNHNLVMLNNITVPVKNPKENFIKQFGYKRQLISGKVPKNARLISEISHSVRKQVENINKNSDNLAAETLFKLAGGNGTTKAGLAKFKEFYKALDADPQSLSIVDASGVSHNDLVQTNWMTLALAKLYNYPEFKNYPDMLAKPGENGTLKNRLLNLKGSLWAKTGSLAGVSGITGYIKAKSGKTYAFAILIQNVKGDLKPAKQLEDRIVNELYEQ